MTQASNESGKRPGQTPRRSCKTIGILLFILMQIAVVGYTALTEFRDGANEIAPKLDERGWLFLLGGVACLAVVLGAETLKYLLMMRALGERRSLRAAFETAALGKYYDNVTPFGAGGQPFQIWWLHRRGYGAGAAGAMPIAGFLTMQWGFILLALVIFVAYRSVELEAMRYTAYFGILFYMAVPCLLIVFTVSPTLAQRVLSFFIRLGAKIRLVKDPDGSLASALKTLTEYRDSFSLIAGKKLLLIVMLALSIVFQIALCSMPFFVLKALGSDVTLGAILATTVYIYAAITVIPTPGNSGAAEGSFYLVFSAAGASGVFWAMLLWRFLCYYAFILIGALIHAADALSARRKKPEA